MSVPAELDVEHARLPANYEQAKTALAECSRVDECQAWADKMAALASYARQINDHLLLSYCRRIQGRAVRRAGEVQQEIEPAQGQQERNENGTIREGSHTYGRVQAARDAGLSDHQRVTAIRVANVPEDEFERQIESDNPPTVTALAEQGRKPRAAPPPLVDLGDRSPEDFAEATKVLGLVTRFVVDSATLDTAAALRGFTAAEKAQALDRVDQAIRWLCQFEGACRVQ